MESTFERPSGLTLRWNMAVKIGWRGCSNDIQQHEVSGRDVHKYFADRSRFLIRPPIVFPGWNRFGQGDNLPLGNIELRQELAAKAVDLRVGFIGRGGSYSAKRCLAIAKPNEMGSSSRKRVGN